MFPKEYLELLSIAAIYSALIFLNTNLFDIGIFSNKKKKILFYFLLLLIAIISIFILANISNKILAEYKYLVISTFLFSVMYLSITNKKFALNIYVLMMVNCSYLLSFIILKAILIYIIDGDTFLTSMSYGGLIFLITELPLSLLFSIFMSEFVNRFYLEVKNKNKRSKISIILPIVSFVLVILIFLLIPANFYEISNKDDILLSLAFLIVLVLFIYLVTLSYFYIVKNERDLENLEIDRDKFESELENITNYMNVLENSTSELRKFKHDYTNIISAIGLYLEEKEYDKLKEYFDELSDYNKVMNSNFKGIDKLKHVKILQVKSLLSYKLIQAGERGIKTSVEVEQDIDSISMNTIDLSRVIGIFLDNAIEATAKCKNPEINIGMMEMDNSLLIVVKNTCTEDTPPVYEIFKKGFSTKGRRRGDGLWIVKSIIDSYGERVTLDTEIKNGFFKHELWISK